MRECGQDSTEELDAAVRDGMFNACEGRKSQIFVKTNENVCHCYERAERAPGVLRHARPGEVYGDLFGNGIENSLVHVVFLVQLQFAVFRNRICINGYCPTGVASSTSPTIP